MPLPKSFTTVTTFSKLLAMFLFILFPFVGFYAGMEYQEKLTPLGIISNQISPTPTAPKGCYYDLKKMCPMKGCNLVCPNPTTTPTIQITPTCKTRPACLDSTPRCMIPETSDMCSTPSKSPKMCRLLAYKNSEGKTCSYSGPNCNLKCD